MSEVSQEERTMGMVAHLISLIGFVIPFGNVIGPLVIWLMKKDTMPFVEDQAKESLNFNITIAIAAIVCSLLMLVLIGFVLLPIVAIAWIVLTIMAAMKANAGEMYRYPFTLRLIK